MKARWGAHRGTGILAAGMLPSCPLGSRPSGLSTRSVLSSLEQGRPYRQRWLGAVDRRRGLPISKTSQCKFLLAEEHQRGGLCFADGVHDCARSHLPCLRISLWTATELAQLLRPPSLACLRHRRATTSACKCRSHTNFLADF